MWGRINDFRSVFYRKQGNGDGGKPHFQKSQNAFMLAPNAEGGRWAKKADMPKPNTCFSASAVNGKIYAIGGYDGQHRVSTLWEYDPVGDKWTDKKNMPTIRSALSTSVVEVDQEI
jgi:N-acetylneuraminic acid mutarotase